MSSRECRTVADYALGDLHAPLGIASDHLTDALPDELKGSLPTIDELERTLPPLPDDENDHA